MKKNKIKIIKNCLIEWYGQTWQDEELGDIAQYVASYSTNDFASILNRLNEQMGDCIEDGELDGLALEIIENLEQNLDIKGE